MEKFGKHKNRTAESVTQENRNNRDDRMHKDSRKINITENPEEEQDRESRQGSDAEEKDSAADIETLKEDIASARQEACENHDRFLRVCAELENYKKRAQRQMDDHRKFSNTELIKDLLPVVDNLERAVEAYRENRQTTESCMFEGVEMTLNEILNILKKYNVTQVDAHGKPFDPNYHEAVMQEESAAHPENTVVNELQKGYLLHDRLIRPSMVVVSKGSSADKKE